MADDKLGSKLPAESGPYAGGKITIADFINKMTFENKQVNQLQPAMPPWQPRLIKHGSPLPEPVFYSINDVITGTTAFWWLATRVRQGIAYSPTAQAHGTMLMKQSYQRKDAKDMMATVQTLKTVILNLEADLEKIGEQKKAFDSKDEEAVKGLFVDNYGGPTRSWTAIARTVPLVRSALTWFYRLDAKPEGEGKEEQNRIKTAWLEQTNKFVDEGQLNIAVANYLKRKVEEYFNWRDQYSKFLHRTHRTIIENLRQQRANLQLYMRWAARNIHEAESILMPYEEVQRMYAGLVPEEVLDFSPKIYSITEMFYDATQWEIVKDWCTPWAPCIASVQSFYFNPDLPGNKFVRGDHIFYFGSIKMKEMKKLKDTIKHQFDDFVEVMKTYAGYSDDQLAAMGVGPTPEEKHAEKTQKEYDKLSEKKEHGTITKEEFQKLNKLAAEIGLEVAEKNEPEVAEISFWKQMTAAVKEQQSESSWDGVKHSFIEFMKPWFELMGSDILDKIDHRQKRSDWIAENSFYKMWGAIKAYNGWPHFE